MYFDEVASKWDTQLRIERAKILAHEIVESLPDTTTYCGLELGCGTGLIAFELSSRFKQVTCIDSSKEMLKIVETKIQELQTNNVSIGNVDMLNKSIFHNKFDVIYSSMVFHHITDTNEMIEQLYNMLKPGGYLIIVDLDEENGNFHKQEKDFIGHNGFNRGKLEELLKSNNLINISSKTVFAGKKQLQEQTINYSLFLFRCQKIG